MFLNIKGRKCNDVLIQGKLNCSLLYLLALWSCWDLEGVLTGSELSQTSPRTKGVTKTPDPSNLCKDLPAHEEPEMSLSVALPLLEDAEIEDDNGAMAKVAKVMTNTPQKLINHIDRTAQELGVSRRHCAGGPRSFSFLAALKGVSASSIGVRSSHEEHSCTLCFSWCIGDTTKHLCSSRHSLLWQTCSASSLIARRWGAKALSCCKCEVESVDAHVMPKSNQAREEFDFEENSPSSKTHQS